MLFADFIKRLMPIAQSAPEFRDHFPPASWKQLFDLGTEAGDGLLVFEVDDLLLAELGGGRVEDVVVPFVRALNQEFAGDRVVDVAAGQIGGQALKLGLIDQVVVNVVPTVFGSGRPFFATGDLAEPLLLEDPTTVVRGDRVTHLLYDVRR